MSVTIFVFSLDGKTLFEQTDELMPLSYPVGQGILINGEPLLVKSLGANVNGRVEVKLDRQSNHPELFCPECKGSLGVTSDRIQCEKKERGLCRRPVPKKN